MEGNYIGTDRTGTKNFGNLGNGILVSGAPGNFIGGPKTGERNIVSGSRLDGVVITGTDSKDNTVRRNHIGTDATGVVAIPNEQAGLLLESAYNFVGGTVDGARNVISGNGQDGVYVSGEQATGNDILGNHIGTGRDGTSRLGNGRNGIRFVAGAGYNKIGGVTTGSKNSIAFNGGGGIATFVDAGGGNSFLWNSVFSNRGLGIDLRADGVTPNDARDRDEGPNGHQNFPLIAFASKYRETKTVVGTLRSTPDSTFTIRFFASGRADPSGHGEGGALLGQRVVTTDSTGKVRYTFMTEKAGIGRFVSATSEFSESVEFQKRDGG